MQICPSVIYQVERGCDPLESQGWVPLSQSFSLHSINNGKERVPHQSRLWNIFCFKWVFKVPSLWCEEKKCIKGAVRSPQKEAAFWHARDNETALCRVGALHLCLLLKCHSDTHTAEGKKQPQKVSHRAMMKALLERSLIRSVPIFRTDQATLKSILFSLFCARWSILSTGSSLKSHKVSKQCHYESSLLLVKPSFKKKHKKEKYNLNLPFLTLNKKTNYQILESCTPANFVLAAVMKQNDSALTLYRETCLAPSGWWK